MLGHSRQDTDRQLVGMRVIHSHELHTGIHQRGDEREIPGESIELGNDQLGFLSFADRKSLL
jgi:hypothetical protein